MKPYLSFFSVWSHDGFFRQEISADLTLINSTNNQVQLFRHLDGNTELCCGENGYGLINGIATAFGSVKSVLNFVAVPRTALSSSLGAVRDGGMMSMQIDDELFREFDEVATKGKDPVNILQVGMIVYSNIKNIARNQGGLANSVLKGSFNETTNIT